MGPGLWLSSLPLHGSEVPERHLSDLNWKDGAMHSERNFDSGGIEDIRRGEGGREGGSQRERLRCTQTVLLF